ncbi:MAG: VOC family protein, partial [Pseudomonadota bacterium]
MTNSHHHINYIEFTAPDLAAMRAFYGKAFGWTFKEWAPTYVSFHGAGIEGGFEQSETSNEGAGVLVILYSDDLEASQKAVEEVGGKITKAAYGFP